MLKRTLINDINHCPSLRLSLRGTLKGKSKEHSKGFVKTELILELLLTEKRDRTCHLTGSCLKQTNQHSPGDINRIRNDNIQNVQEKIQNYFASCNFLSCNFLLHVKANKQIIYITGKYNKLSSEKMPVLRWLMLELSPKEIKAAIIIIVNKIMVNTLETTEKNKILSRETIF